MGNRDQNSRHEGYRKLYREYIEMLSKMGSVVQTVPEQKFVELLENQRKQLLATHGCKDVLFSIVTRDGKPAIQPQLITDKTKTHTGIPKAAADPDRKVFEAYLRMRKRCGQVTQGFVFEDFKAQLDQSRRSCREKFGWNNVEFQVTTKDGKAVILPRRSGTIPGMAGIHRTDDQQADESESGKGRSSVTRKPAGPPPPPEPAAKPKAKAADPSKIPELEKALKANPGDAALTEALADAYEAAGDIERARDLYGRAEDLYHETQNLVRMDEVGKKLRSLGRKRTSPPTAKGTGIVAVLEINPSLADFIVSTLEQVGRQADRFNTVNELFEKVKSSTHAAVIMDFDLGGRNPYAVCSRLKSYPDTSDIPLVAVMPEGTTPETIRQDKQSSWAAQAYVVKPMNKEKLLSALREIRLV